MRRWLTLALVCALPLPGWATVRVRAVAASIAPAGAVAAGAALAPLSHHTFAAPAVLSPAAQAPSALASAQVLPQAAAPVAAASSDFTGARAAAAVPISPVAVSPARISPAPASGAQQRGREGRAAAPSFRQRLKRVGERLQDLKPGKPGAALAASNELFDGAGSFEAGEADWPKLPAGAKRVRAEVARTPADIDRLIRAHSNTINLIAELKKKIRQRGPLTLLVYEDEFGQEFVAMDIYRDPSWLDDLPDVDAHERHHLRKILRRFPDVQFMVREEGKTPDLMINGVLTELKADFGDFSLNRLIGKANRQVDEFNRRHMLATGEVAVDLRQWDYVPKDEVLRRVNDWARGTRFLALERIWVYAGDDMQVLRRGDDHRYFWEDEAAEEALSAEEETRRLLDVQLLAKKGYIGEAQRRLGALERRVGGGDDAHSPLAQARGAIAAYRTLGRMRRVLGRPGGLNAARSIWERFKQRALPETVREVEGAARDLLGDPPPGVPELTAGRLRAKGVRALVAVYGGERVRPKADAEHGLRVVQKRLGNNPKKSADRARLARARRALALSRYYEEARVFGKLVARGGRGHLAVGTHGGGGVAAAANRGAHENGGPSTGFRVDGDGRANPYLSEDLEFRYGRDDLRDRALREGSAAHVFFPGGFTTADNLLSILTRIDAGTLAPAPIILIGQRQRWEKELPLSDWVERGLVSQEVRSLVAFVKTAQEAWQTVEASLADNTGD